jgi:hypothetical protein
MQIARNGPALYVGHAGSSGKGTSVLDVSDPAAPELVSQSDAPAGGHSHKAVWADGLLLINHEGYRGGRIDRPGMAIHDTSDPFDPTEIGFWDSTGKGVHRISYTGGRYVYLSATPEGFGSRIWCVIDIADPTDPTEVGRWWWPGMASGESADWPEGEDRSVHHALVDGDRAYLGLWDSGMVILDVADLAAPALVSFSSGGRAASGSSSGMPPGAPRPWADRSSPASRPSGSTWPRTATTWASSSTRSGTPSACSTSSRGATVTGSSASSRSASWTGRSTTTIATPATRGWTWARTTMGASCTTTA